VVVGMARRMASAMKKAQQANDLAKQIEILKAVDARTPAFQHKYREWLTK